MEEQVTKYEHVDHPAHYGGKDSPYEAIKVISAWLGSRGVFDFDLGNALKYICRAGAKPSDSGVSGLKQDLQKAVWYLNHAIEVVSFQSCLVRKDDGFDSDSSATKEASSSSSSDATTSDALCIHGASLVMVRRLIELLTTRYGPFITMLSNTAYDYRYKKRDEETCECLQGFLDSCKSFVAEVAADMRAKETGVSGEAVGAEAGNGAGENYRVGGTE